MNTLTWALNTTPQPVFTAWTSTLFLLEPENVLEEEEQEQAHLATSR